MAPSQPNEVSIYAAVGSGGELSGLDDQLLKIVAAAGGHISGEEISRELNISSMTPMRCVQRIREILKSQDILSQSDQKALILRDFVSLRDKLFEQINDGDEVITKGGDVVNVATSAGYYNAMIRLLKEWSALITSMRTDIQQETVLIRQAHAKIMMGAIEVMFDSMMDGLKDQGYDIPHALGMQLLEEAMPKVFQSIDKRTSHD